MIDYKIYRLCRLLRLSSQDIIKKICTFKGCGCGIEERKPFIYFEYCDCLKNEIGFTTHELIINDKENKREVGLCFSGNTIIINIEYWLRELKKFNMDDDSIYQILFNLCSISLYIELFKMISLLNNEFILTIDNVNTLSKDELDDETIKYIENNKYNLNVNILDDVISCIFKYFKDDEMMMLLLEFIIIKTKYIQNNIDEQQEINLKESLIADIKNKLKK